jgi:hypothetical protein
MAVNYILSNVLIMILIVYLPIRPIVIFIIVVNRAIHQYLSVQMVKHLIVRMAHILIDVNQKT